MDVLQKNHCKELADMLGVAVGEQFNILDDEDRICDLSPYHIDAENGLLDNENDPAVDSVYKSVIDGSWSIQRLPIADARVKVYFYVDTEGHIKAKVDEDSVFDLTMYDYGNYFSNRSQATAKIEEMLEKLWKTKGEKEG